MPFFIALKINPFSLKKLTLAKRKNRLTTEGEKQ